MSSTRAKLGGWLLRPAVQALRDEIDPEGPGGAYMLGLRQLGVVAHGRFTRRGFARAIEVAAQASRRTWSTRHVGARGGGRAATPRPGRGAERDGSSEVAATVSGHDS